MKEERKTAKESKHSFRQPGGSRFRVIRREKTVKKSICSGLLQATATVGQNGWRTGNILSPGKRKRSEIKLVTVKAWRKEFGIQRVSLNCAPRMRAEAQSKQEQLRLGNAGIRSRSYTYVVAESFKETLRLRESLRRGTWNPKAAVSLCISTFSAKRPISFRNYLVLLPRVTMITFTRFVSASRNFVPNKCKWF